MTIICDENGFLVNTETGEILDDRCFEISEKVQDHDLEHYSVTPPIPYVPQKYVEKMKQYNKWLKGKEKFITLTQQMIKVINYYARVCKENCDFDNQASLGSKEG